MTLCGPHDTYKISLGAVIGELKLKKEIDLIFKMLRPKFIKFRAQAREELFKFLYFLN